MVAVSPTTAAMAHFMDACNVFQNPDAYTTIGSKKSAARENRISSVNTARAQKTIYILRVAVPACCVLLPMKDAEKRRNMMR